MSIKRIKPRAALNMKKLQRMGDFIGKMRGIALNMSNNPLIFTDPIPPLSEFSLHIDELEDAQALTLTRKLGSIKKRDHKYNIVLNDAISLMGYVQNLANRADEEDDSLAVIAHSGFDLKHRGVHIKAELDARNTKISGVVKLIAKSPGKGSTNMWQISDDEKNWTSLPGTTKATTYIKDLLPASTKYFRHRAVTVLGETEWSQIISLIVT